MMQLLHSSKLTKKKNNTFGPHRSISWILTYVMVIMKSNRESMISSFLRSKSKMGKFLGS